MQSDWDREAHNPLRPRPRAISESSVTEAHLQGQRLCALSRPHSEAILLLATLATLANAFPPLPVPTSERPPRSLLQSQLELTSGGLQVDSNYGQFSSPSQALSSEVWPLPTANELPSTNTSPQLSGANHRKRRLEHSPESTPEQAHARNRRKMNTYAYMASPATFTGHHSHYGSPQQFPFTDYSAMQLPDVQFDTRPMLEQSNTPRVDSRSFSHSPGSLTEKDVELAQRRQQSQQVRRISKTRRRQDSSPHQNPLVAGTPQQRFDFCSGYSSTTMETLPSTAPVHAPDVSLIQSSRENGPVGDPFSFPMDNSGQAGHFGITSLGMSPNMSVGSSDALYQPSPLRSTSEILDRGPLNSNQRPGLPQRSTSSSRADEQVRVINSRPKPRCWDHGCNGRQFSTFSNLLRHQREKSGTATKSYCPRCGAEFTRTTARNGHMAHEKCKARKDS
ncbi:MAG: hypothetical protein M1837_003528 [Sclerophora amabilis]|nr:MAG: hypothetical protein M1837_003528 [Sclerophora amabilis]